ncbi:GIY-YIG nuclease family protein [Bacillus sp. 1P06AnD]|uniref:GIY-YIG nuclease family protein n=1 Tax=Bacillus sp. 1P06AnD TaxID=3132208 RepID=UPI0039A1A376
MFNVLEPILITSGLTSLFELKVKDDNTTQSTPWVAYRVKTNLYKIRAFELWGKDSNVFFRVYHSPSINKNLKNMLVSFPEVIQNKNATIDYRTDNYVMLAKRIADILLSDEIIKECKASSKLARTSKFEGLELPDVDTAQEEVMGQTFTWREIIAIWEDNTEENKLKEILSGNGVYIQRSKDGESRYIGSAYGSNGIIGRWMAHLNSLGDAQHLNLFVLENGYNSILFSIIEFVDGSPSEIIQKESMWKKTLGTVNYGPYNSIQLNNN